MMSMMHVNYGALLVRMRNVLVSLWSCDKLWLTYHHFLPSAGQLDLMHARSILHLTLQRNVEGRGSIRTKAKLLGCYCDEDKVKISNSFARRKSRHNNYCRLLVHLWHLYRECNFFFVFLTLIQTVHGIPFCSVWSLMTTTKIR